MKTEIQMDNRQIYINNKRPSFTLRTVYYKAVFTMYLHLIVTYPISVDFLQREDRKKEHNIGRSLTDCLLSYWASCNR